MTCFYSLRHFEALKKGRGSGRVVRPSGVCLRRASQTADQAIAVSVVRLRRVRCPSGRALSASGDRLSPGRCLSGRALSASVVCLCLSESARHTLRDRQKKSNLTGCSPGFVALRACSIAELRAMFSSE